MCELGNSNTYGNNRGKEKSYVIGIKTEATAKKKLNLSFNGSAVFVENSAWKCLSTCDLI